MYILSEDFVHIAQPCIELLIFHLCMYLTSNSSTYTVNIQPPAELKWNEGYKLWVSCMAHSGSGGQAAASWRLTYNAASQRASMLLSGSSAVLNCTSPGAVKAPCSYWQVNPPNKKRMTHSPSPCPCFRKNAVTQWDGQKEQGRGGCRVLCACSGYDPPGPV